MEEIIDRELRAEATPAELERLAEWRRASFANEREYRRLVRMLAALRGASALRSAPPSVVDVLARAQAPVVQRKVFTRWTPWLIGLAAAAGVVAGIALQGPASSVGSWGLADVATGPAEMTTVELRDGSVVRLAPATRLRVTDSRDAREVTLDGRAYFVVAKMPDRPFVVYTSVGSARVLGTRFELATHDQDLKLIVVEGSVGLTAGSSNVEVHAGEQSGVREQRALAPTRVEQADQIEQWVGKFLVFQSTPIRDVAREIERMYGVRITVADSIIGRRTITATFTDQTVARVLDVVCSVANAQCETRRVTGGLPSETVISHR
jgi:ferric-dicitrate binding protein FerR (iron transport regulator)